MEYMCVVLTLATSTMSGATFHVLFMMLLMSGLYFVVFLTRFYAANMSLQYVKSILNCMVNFGVGASGRGCLYMWPIEHNISGVRLAFQWHLWAPHVHGNSHVGIVFSCGSSSCVMRSRVYSVLIF